jgi:hypothetical protein
MANEQRYIGPVWPTAPQQGQCGCSPRESAGVAGPDWPRPDWTMERGSDKQGYFNGPQTFAASSTQLNGTIPDTTPRSPLPTCPMCNSTWRYQ